MQERFPAPSLARVLVLLSIPVVAYFGCAATQKALDMYGLQRYAGDLRSEVGALQAKHKELQEQIAYYRSDEYVEKVAREELNLIRPGDTPVVVVSRAAPPAPAPVPPAAPAREGAPRWRQWLDLFFDR